MNITLESHLKAISEEEGNKLYSNWMVIKQELCSKLETVSNYFQHFSLHNATHSQEICNNIERFLGQDRIKKLSATDTWMLLMAFYSHDIGMALKYENIKEIFEEKKFKEELKELSEGKSPELREAAKRVMAFEEVHGCLDNLKGKKALDIFRDVQLIIEEHYRKGHATRSADYIAEFLEDRFTTINSRMIELLKKICIAHQEDIKNIEKLHYEENGMFQDYVHPRFIAAMLCLGDLLDMDTNRFSKYGVEAASTMAHESELHKQKHESLKHFLIKPDGIEIEMDSPSVEVHRVSRQWIDWIEDTIKYLTLNWSVIAPEDFGNPPKLKEKKLMINGSELFNGFADLRFTIDQDKALEILQGAGIYKDKFVCIREVIQNAVDSSLIQLWKDLDIIKKKKKIEEDKQLSEEYIEYIQCDLDGENNIDNSKIVQQIKFWETLNVTDIDEEIIRDNLNKFKDYNIEVFIYVNDEKQVVIEVCDKGTGISNESLKALANIGTKKDKRSDKDIINSMPGWLKPSGQFGLGLQSIFLIADKFEMITKCENEHGKKIVFESGENNTGYITVEGHDKTKRGTNLKIYINEDKISEDEIGIDKFSLKIKEKHQWIEEFIVDKIKKDDMLNESKSSAKWSNTNYFNINIYNNIKVNKINFKQEKIKQYKAMFLEDEFIELINRGKFTYIEDRDLKMQFQYFDAESKIMCQIDFNPIIQFRGNNNYLNLKDVLVNNEIFFKNIFVCNLGYNPMRQFKFSLNILDEKADYFLNINRNEIKESCINKFNNLIYNVLKRCFQEMLKNILKEEQDKDVNEKINKYKYYPVIYEVLRNFNIYNEEIYEICKNKCSNYKYRISLTLSEKDMISSNIFPIYSSFEYIYKTRLKSISSLPYKVRKFLDSNNLDELESIEKEKIIILDNELTFDEYGTLIIDNNYDIIQNKYLEFIRNDTSNSISYATKKIQLVNIEGNIYVLKERIPFVRGRNQIILDCDDTILLATFLLAIKENQTMIFGVEKFKNLVLEENENNIIRLPFKTDDYKDIRDCIINNKINEFDKKKFKNSIINTEYFKYLVEYVSEKHKSDNESIRRTYYDLIDSYLNLLIKPDNNENPYEEFIKNVITDDNFSYALRRLIN